VRKNAKSLGGDPDRIGVCGDSGGGNLATIVTRKSLRDNIQPLFTTLIYPSVDLCKTDYPSHQQFGEGHFLTNKSIESFRDFYLPRKADWTLPDASPLRSADQELANLPPHFIYVAGCDPLRDEGLAYAKRLQELGVLTTVHVEVEQIHGFLAFINSAAAPAASALAEPVFEIIAAEMRNEFFKARSNRPSAG
jgi:acetyl esterase